MIKIRKATLQDTLAIQLLNNQLCNLEREKFDKYLIKDYATSKEGEEYFKNSIKNDYVIVAEENKKVVGYLLGARNDVVYYNFKIAELCNMCIDEAYRQHGIGTLLFKEFEKHFNSLNITHFTVTASFKNESAKAFYKKMGFEEINTTFIKE